MSKRRRLLIATCKGFTNIVNELLAVGADPNQRRSGGVTRHDPANNSTTVVKDEMTPLYMAASLNLPELTAALLKAGARVNDKVKIVVPNNRIHKESPLFIAAQLGHLEVADLLIKANANIDDVWGEGSDNATFTPLCMAVQEGHTEMARKLIAAAGSTCVRAALGNLSTLLLTSVYNGNLELTNVLLEANADPNTTMETEGQTLDLLSLATHANHLDIAKVLLVAQKAQPETITTLAVHGEGEAPGTGADHIMVRFMRAKTADMELLFQQKMPHTNLERHYNRKPIVPTNTGEAPSSANLLRNPAKPSEDPTTAWVKASMQNAHSMNSRASAAKPAARSKARKGAAAPVKIARPWDN
jgi:hypothetical protein